MDVKRRLLTQCGILTWLIILDFNCTYGSFKAFNTTASNLNHNFTVNNPSSVTFSVTASQSANITVTSTTNPFEDGYNIHILERSLTVSRLASKDEILHWNHTESFTLLDGVGFLLRLNNTNFDLTMLSGSSPSKTWELYVPNAPMVHIVSFISEQDASWEVVFQDHRGSSFNIGFMKNRDSDQPLELYLTNTNTRVKPMSVSISSNKESTVEVSLQSKESTRIPLDRDLFQPTRIEKSNKGLFVNTSESVLTVVGFNKRPSTGDGYLALPVEVLGLEYYVVSYETQLKKCLLLVVAMEKDTDVVITINNKTLANESFTYYRKEIFPGGIITETIDSGHTIFIQSDEDLTGSLIKASKKVSVLSGTQRMSTQHESSQAGYDYAVEQIPPTNSWGKTFAVVPVPIPGTVKGDILKIVSSRPTTVTITCKSSHALYDLLYKGDFFTYDLPCNENCYVRATAGVLVTQFTRSHDDHMYDDTDPSMTIVPPIEQYTSDFIFTTPLSSGYNGTVPYTYNYILFVIEGKEFPDLLIDGAPLWMFANNISDIPATSLVGGNLLIGHGEHIINHTSPTAVYSVILYGAAPNQAYSFPLGMKVDSINQDVTPEQEEIQTTTETTQVTTTTEIMSTPQSDLSSLPSVSTNGTFFVHAVCNDDIVYNDAAIKVRVISRSHCVLTCLEGNMTVATHCTADDYCYCHRSVSNGYTIVPHHNCKTFGYDENVNVCP